VAYWERGRQSDDEAGLAARAAWLYFAGGLTQAEIAKRLGVPSTKAHRLVARANRDGLVRVHVDASVADCVHLEERLSERFALAFCRVAPDLQEGALPLRALGASGASFLKNAIEQEKYDSIGVGNGRTLAAVVDQLPSLHTKRTRFVSVLGGLTRKFAANPFDVIHRLAEKTGAEAYLMPAPIFANSREDKSVLMAQMGVAEVFEMARGASLILAGIGEMTDTGFLIATGMIRAEERAEIARAKARGEILGHFFAGDGRPVETELNARALSLTLQELAQLRLVAVAGGTHKIEAILAVLRSGILSGLITDEVTAKHLADAPEHKGSARRRRRPRDTIK
jgi:DNA-binding transcriptional regulator LsrR (DeoR family)